MSCERSPGKVTYWSAPILIGFCQKTAVRLPAAYRAEEAVGMDCFLRESQVQQVSKKDSEVILNQLQEDVYEMMAMPDRYRAYFESV